MSLYNMINGFNPISVFITPMLFNIHPQELPRYRDCFLATDERKYEEDIILIYTRVGGGNRGQGYGEEIFYKHPNFLDTYDDDFDNTFGNYIFSVPEQFKDDYKKIKGGDIKNISMNLQDKCRKIFPKLEETFNKIWCSEVNNENQPIPNNSPDSSRAGTDE